MSKYDYGLGGVPDINTFVNLQIEKLKKCEQNFQSVFDFMFALKNNVLAEYNDGNRIFTVTYGECKDKIIKISPGLKKLFGGEEKNSIIGIYMDNRIEWIQIFWAVLRAGYVPLLMNKRIDKSVLEDVLSDNGVKGVITDSESFGVPTYDYKEICENECGEDETDAVWADEIIFMSSGTSGNVKLCVYEGKKICEQIYNSKNIVEQSNEIQAHTEGKIKQLAFLPFYHVFGFLACYMWFAFFTRTFVFLANQNSDTILKTIRKHKVTHIFAVPMLWTKVEAAVIKTVCERGEATVKKLKKSVKISTKLQNMGFSNAFARKAFKEVRDNLFGDSVKFMISGGGSIPGRTLEFFNAIGYRLVNGYGMSEVGITSVQLSSKPKVINTASVGEPFCSVEYKIIDGELAIKGKSLASYIIADGVRKKISENEWFMTEDLTAHDKYGWYLRGRKDDLIVNTSGENISPERVEACVDVEGAQCVLLGIEREDGSVCSRMVVSVAAEADTKRIQAEVIEQLKRGEMFRFVDSIKLTYEPLIKGNEFKLSRRRIRSDILSGKMKFIDAERKTTATGEIDDVKKSVIEAFEKALDKHIEATQHDLNFFYELEGTSLGYFELVEEIKQRFDINILSGKDSVLYSINEVYEYISKKAEH